MIAGRPLSLPRYLRYNPYDENHGDERQRDLGPAKNGVRQQHHFLAALAMGVHVSELDLVLPQKTGEHLVQAVHVLFVELLGPLADQVDLLCQILRLCKILGL